MSDYVKFDCDECRKQSLYIMLIRIKAERVSGSEKNEKNEKNATIIRKQSERSYSIGSGWNEDARHVLPVGSNGNKSLR